MKQTCLAILVLCFITQCEGQYFLRGEVRDDKGKPLKNVKLNLFSKFNISYYTNASGSFGIQSSISFDTLTATIDGFETFKEPVESTRFQSIVLKSLADYASFTKNKLVSFTKDFWKSKKYEYDQTNESYSSLVENDFINAEKYPETGFALNIDRASYSNIRRFLNMETKVPPDAVRIEEMLNYFNFTNTNNDTVNHSFDCKTQLTTCPWNKDNKLLFVNLQAPKLNMQSVPPSNLVFLIDVSGSMDRDNRLPLIQSGLKLLVQNLREQDTVAIVIYGGAVAILLQPTSGAEKEKIIDAINKLEANGDTPGAAAIKTAYRLVETSFNPKANNRIILATDGDFNVGQTTEKELEDIVTAHRQAGIYLTCIGVGMGNYKDSKLETLAKKGNGNFAYIDNLKEAEKILVTEFSKTLYAVANDAYTSINFNPRTVKEYRLIGFDNKKDVLDDAGSQLCGGEVGSGHTLIGVFEIIPVDSNFSHEDKLATLSLHYKLPIDNKEWTQNLQVPFKAVELDSADASLRFATAVTMFGSLLKHSQYEKNFSWDDVKTIALNCYNTNDILQTEFVGLIDKAKSIYEDKKKKKQE